MVPRRDRDTYGEVEILQTLFGVGRLRNRSGAVCLVRAAHSRQVASREKEAHIEEGIEKGKGKRYASPERLDSEASTNLRGKKKGHFTRKSHGKKRMQIEGKERVGRSENLYRLRNLSAIHSGDL